MDERTGMGKHVVGDIGRRLDIIIDVPLVGKGKHDRDMDVVDGT